MSSNPCEAARVRQRDSESAVLAAVKAWIRARGTVTEADAAKRLTAIFGEWETATDEYIALIDHEVRRVQA